MSCAVTGVLGGGDKTPPRSWRRQSPVFSHALNGLGKKERISQLNPPSVPHSLIYPAYLFFCRPLFCLSTAVVVIGIIPSVLRTSLLCSIHPVSGLTPKASSGTYFSFCQSRATLRLYRLSLSGPRPIGAFRTINLNPSTLVSATRT